MASILPDSVETALGILRAGGDDRAEGASQLRAAVATSAREMNPEHFVAFETALFRRIFGMVGAGGSVQERRGGVAAMDALVEAVSSAPETKVIKFANTFKYMITANSDGPLLGEVAEALGHLARCSAVPNNDFVEFEVPPPPQHTPTPKARLVQATR